MNSVVTAILLVALLVGLAKYVFDRWILARPIVWLVTLSAYAVIYIVSVNEAPFFRMVLLCCVLMAGMKWVVYSEWRRQDRVALSWSCWLCFALLWFGMNPAAWVGERRELKWKSDAYWGLGGCLFGGVAVAVMARFQVSSVVLLFIGMSLGFHYGCLRLLTAFWRLQGRPVRPLFRNPFVMRGFTDFWAKRWNLAYSQMMVRAVKRPLLPYLGKRGALFAVFLISGLLHELAITVPVQAGYGLPSLFFLIQGVLTVSEKRSGPLQAVLCGVSLVVMLPLLFSGAFVEAVIFPARDVLNLIK